VAATRLPQIPPSGAAATSGFWADNTTFDGNEIAYNGPEQKVGRSANVTFRNNFVHHNISDGIWYDTNPKAGAVIEGNRVEDNGRDGISFEASIGANIRNNTLRRNGERRGVYLHVPERPDPTTTRSRPISGASLFPRLRQYCPRWTMSRTMRRTTTRSSSDTQELHAYANGFKPTSCTSGQLTPYLNGSKNLTFSHNRYRVPSLSFTRYFLWDGWKNSNQWQALGHDVEGSISQ
jgi:parallel beta-helix repeat protein